MTRTTNARVAGITFLLYIVAGVAGLILSGRATGAEGMAAKLALIGQHASDVHISVLLSLLCGITALVLGVSLYGITRDEDDELAVLALCCRVGEGMLAAISIIAKLGLLWIATATEPGALDTTTAQALGLFLQKTQVWNVIIAATLFSIGSTIFCYLLLRGRMVPVPLAWLGIVASVLLVVSLPPQLIGYFGGSAAMLVWLPMLVFEVTIAFWFIIKGVKKRAL